MKMAPLEKKFKKCSHKNCYSNSNKNPELRFFCFPLNLVSEWIAASGNEKLKKLSRTTVHNCHYICEKHFDALDYTRILSPFKKSLRKGVIPKKYVEPSHSDEDSESSDDSNFDSHVSRPASPVESAISQRTLQEKENSSNTKFIQPENGALPTSEEVHPKSIGSALEAAKTPSSNSLEIPCKTIAATVVQTSVEAQINNPVQDFNKTSVMSDSEVLTRIPARTHIPITPIKDPFALPAIPSVTNPVTPAAIPVIPRVQNSFTPLKIPVIPPLKIPVIPPLRKSILAQVRLPGDNHAIPIVGIANSSVRAQAPQFALIQSMNSMVAAVDCPTSTSGVTPLIASVSTSVVTNINKPVFTSIAALVRTAVTTSVTASITAPVMTSVVTPIRTPVTTSVATPVRTEVPDASATPIRISVTTSVATSTNIPVSTTAETPIKISFTTSNAGNAMTEPSVNTSCDPAQKKAVSFSIRCSVCHTAEVWACSVCQAKGCDQVVVPEEPTASDIDSSEKLIKCNVKLERVENLDNASSDVCSSEDGVSKTSNTLIMRLYEKIKVLEQQLQALNEAAAAAKDVSDVSGLPEDATKGTSGTKGFFLATAESNSGSVREMRSILKREKEQEMSDNLDANERLGFIEEDVNKLKDNIKAIQHLAASIQAVIEEKYLTYKKQDLSQPFLRTTFQCQFPPAKTVEELNRLSRHPKMIQHLLEIKESTITKTVIQMVKCLVSEELARKYSWTGSSRRSIIAFKETAACRAVEQAVLSSPNCHLLLRRLIIRATKSAFEDSSDWNCSHPKSVKRKREKQQVVDELSPNSGAFGRLLVDTSEETAEPIEDDGLMVVDLLGAEIIS